MKDQLNNMRRKCPICGRMVVKRSNGKLYRHKSLQPQWKVVMGIKVPLDFCQGSGKKVGK